MRSSRRLAVVALTLSLALLPACGRGGPAAEREPGPTASVLPPTSERVEQAIRKALRDTRVYLAERDPSNGDAETVLVLANGDRYTKGTDSWQRYDASAGTFLRYSRFDGREQVDEWTELAPGLPDTAVERFWDVAPDAIAKTALSLDLSTAVETDHHGRPAWTLQGPVLRAHADHAAITIDRATGLGLRLQLFEAARPGLDVRWQTIVVDPPVSPETFLPPFPDLPRQHVTVGFEPVPLDGLARAVGYRPLLPTVLPDGFAAKRSAVAASIAVVDDYLNPESRRVVSVTYRRGLERFTVSNRLRGTGLERDQWRSPYNATESAPVVYNPERVRLAGGALDGVLAEVSTRGATRPNHLWALTNDLVIFIVGDLDRDGLVAVAQSLGAT
jgi:hypothetical protein